ncbi:hypothetical protein [Streptomyces sp. NPDC048663]|uniref:hypothetical protein n=1 Tax=Streptomyces sp. NPDC048663 TaxID=3155638 RepID=UPI0034176840
MSTSIQPDVRLVLTVDLAGPYGSFHQVNADLRDQTRRLIECDTVIVRLGADAVRHHLELGKAIAGAFYQSARRIEVHAPAGNVLGPIIHAEVARYVRLFSADHAPHTALQEAAAAPGAPPE